MKKYSSLSLTAFISHYPLFQSLLIFISLHRQMSSFTDSGILLLLGQNVLLVKRHMDSALKSVKFLFLSFFGVGGAGVYCKV